MTKKYNYYYYFIFLFFISNLFFFLFFNQAFPLYGYSSDLPIHIANLPDDYSLINLIIIKIQNFLSISKADIRLLPIAISIILLTLSISFISFLINFYLKFKYKDLNPYITDFFSIALIFVSMLIYSFWQWTYYLGKFSPNIWHNSTTIYCKLVSLPVFILLWFVYNEYTEGKLRYGYILLLSLFAFLSAYVKPSFIISFLPSVFIVILYYLIRKKINFYFFVIILLSLGSSLIPLWIINQYLYKQDASSSSVIIALGLVWRQHTRAIPLALLLSSAFPFFVAIVTIIKKRMNFLFSIALINYIIAVIMYYVFAESGVRMYDGNFGWSGQMAIFLLFLAAVEEFYFSKNNYAKTVKYAGSFLFTWHLVSGLFYFGRILLGYDYG